MEQGGGGAWAIGQQQQQQWPARDEVQVWQWLAAQQEAGAAHAGADELQRGYSSRLLSSRSQEAFWGNAATSNLPRVAGLYG